MRKIAFIGAGSFEFTRNLVKDILTFDALQDVEIALMDIDANRLKYITKAVEKIKQKGNYKNLQIKPTTDRVEALKNADGVLITILHGGVDVWRKDIEIPKQFGVDINVGDTRGPAGIFRALRSIPVFLDIAADIEKYCPNALVLNYTNPMAMLCSAIQKTTDLNFTGLCHSVQGTAEMLARWIDVKMPQVQYLCAGINHQAWYLKYEVDGKDAYPKIKAAIENNPDILNEEQVRNDMYQHLGYYVTESSGHNSEYNAWYRKRPDLIKKYCTNGTGWNPGHYAFIRDTYLQKEKTWEDEIQQWLSDDDIDLSKGHEYASYIFNAVFGDGTYFQFNGNVTNNGLIENLPAGCCVEVPVLASQRGLDPLAVGKLPTHLAALNSINASVEMLAVEGALAGDKDAIYQAIYLDPLTSAVLSLSEIKKMVDQMFAANKAYLGYFG
ncbi:MAG: alpha-galactosidase [Eubacteriales bacterium]